MKNRMMLEGEEDFVDLFGKNIPQKTKRLITYIDATSSSKIFKQALLPPFLGMTLGGTLGGILGLVGGPKGAAVGAGSGVGVGLFAGSCFATYQTRRAYKKWLSQYRSDQILPRFIEIFKKHKDFEEFICPLTNELLHFPFVDPWGHSYEKKAIESWVRKHGISPIAKAPLKISQLRPNYCLMGKQAAAYKEMLQGEAESVLLTAIQKKGVAALLEDLERQIESCFQAENKALFDLLKEGRITKKAYVSELGLMVELFYKSC